MKFKKPITPAEIEADRKKFYYGCWIPMVLATALSAIVAFAFFVSLFFLP